MPRTTSRGDGKRHEDAYAVPSPANSTAQLDREGWFLVRFQKPVARGHFKRFVTGVFMGQLTDAHRDELLRVCDFPNLG